MVQQQTQQRRGLDVEGIRSALAGAQTIFKAQTRDTGLVWDSEMDFAVKTINTDPFDRLRLCTPQSIEMAMRDLAHVGLSLNPLKHHATLIPRWAEKANTWECCVLVMYRGMVYLATQAGVHDIVVDVVYKTDAFKVMRRSDGDHFEHEIDVSTARGGENFFLGSYVSARMPSSKERKVEWVPAEDIFKMRDASDSYLDKEGKPRPNSPWVAWFDEMAKKGALKRATKRWEEAVEHTTRWQRLAAAVDLDNRTDYKAIIEGHAKEIDVPKLSMEQVAEVERVVSGMYSDEGNRVKFLRKICNAYGCDVLADVPQVKYTELLERVTASAAEAEARKRKVKKKAPPEGAAT